MEAHSVPASAGRRAPPASQRAWTSPRGPRFLRRRRTSLWLLPQASPPFCRAGPRIWSGWSRVSRRSFENLACNRHGRRRDSPAGVGGGWPRETALSVCTPGHCYGRGPGPDMLAGTRARGSSVRRGRAGGELRHRLRLTGACLRRSARPLTFSPRLSLLSVCVPYYHL